MDFPLTQEIIDAVVAAKAKQPNALLMCDTVAKKFSSTELNGNPIWTLPQEYKYLNLPDNQRLYYCASGQFVEDIKYSSGGSIDQLLDSLKKGIDSVSNTAKETKDTLKTETSKGFRTLATIALLGLGIATITILVKK